MTLPNAPPVGSPGRDLLRRALHRQPDTTSPAGIEATAASVSDEVMQDAIERRRREAERAAASK